MTAYQLLALHYAEALQKFAALDAVPEAQRDVAAHRAAYNSMLDHHNDMYVAAKALVA